VDTVVVATTIAAHVTLTLLVVTVPKKHVHMGVVVKNVPGVVHAIAVQDHVNAQMDILVHLVNASTARMTVAVKVLATQQQECAVVLVDTLVMIAVHVYAQKGMIH
jgi:hypothetical protein